MAVNHRAFAKAQAKREAIVLHTRRSRSGEGYEVADQKGRPAAIGFETEAEGNQWILDNTKPKGIDVLTPSGNSDIEHERQELLDRYDPRRGG